MSRFSAPTRFSVELPGEEDEEAKWLLVLPAN